MNSSIFETRGADLPDRAEKWIERFRALLDGDWTPGGAESLHESLDSLVIESDMEGYGSLSEAGLELSSYLCALLDGQAAAPSEAQREQMRELTDAIAANTRKPPDGLSAAQKVSHLPSALEAATSKFAAPAAAAVTHRVRQVWSVIEDLELVAILTEAFAERGIEYFPCAPHTAVAQSIPETGVQLVIVDNGSLGVLIELQHRGMVGSQGAEPRPTYVALLQDQRTDERLRALRAGADHVITFSDDAATMARRIDKILAARSEEPLRVLVVDDDRSQTRFCSGILSRVGIDAVCCNDAASALEELRKGFPDILLVDLHMPDIDGLALTEMLLEMPGSEHVAVLFLSGDDEPETRFDALTAGGDDFLSKPIQPRHLIRAVTAHGKRVHRRRRAAAQR
jgi:CheY-like chemotaxis protein